MTGHNWIVLGLLVVCSLSAFGGGYYTGYLRATERAQGMLEALRLEYAYYIKSWQPAKGSDDELTIEIT